MNKHILLILTFLIAGRLIADELPNSEKTNKGCKYTVQGIIRNNGENLPFVNIVLKNTHVGVSTDINGSFCLKNISEPKITLVIHGIGYRKKEIEVDLKKQKNKSLEINLEKDVILIDQVVVTGDRNEKQRKDVPVVVNVISSRKFNLTNTTSLADGLQFTPGLRIENNCQNCGFSQLRMNGMEGPYTQILINSRPVFSGLAGVYGLEQIPAGMVERIEVVRGGGSALYGGNAIAGIVNIITKDPIDNKFGINFTNNITGVGTDSDQPSIGNSIDFHTSVMGKNKQSGLFVFGNVRQQDDWDANNDGFSEITNQKGISAGLDFTLKPGDRQKLNFDYHTMNEYRRGGSDFDVPVDKSRVAEMVKHNINGGGISYDRFFGESNKFSAYTSAQQLYRDSYYGANQDSTAFGRTTDFTIVNGLQTSINLEKFLFAPANILAGGEYKFETLYDEKLGGYLDSLGNKVPNSTIADQQTHTAGFFAQSEWNIGFMRMLTGLRYDHFDIKDNISNTGNYSGNVFVPRFNLLFDVTETMQVRLSYARGYRAPQIFDEDLHIEASGARRIIHQNSADLEQENSNSLSGSVDYTRSGDGWQLYLLAEGFYTLLENPFNSEYTEKDSTGTVYAIRHNANSGAYVTGINLEAKYANGDNFELQAGLTIQQSMFKEMQQWGEEENSLSDKMLRTPAQYGYITINVFPWHKFNVSLTGNYSGPMYVPHLAGGIANNGTEITNEELVKTNPFVEIGLRVCKSFDVKKIGKIEVCAGIANALNAYQDDFDMGVNRDAGYIYGPRKPRNIYFGIKIMNF